MTSMYAAISATIAREHAVARHQPRVAVPDQRFSIYVESDDDEDDDTADSAQPEEDAGYVRPDVCVRCGGRVYALQRCQRCFPTVQVGERTRGEVLDSDTWRQSQARLAGHKTFDSTERCPKCHTRERHVVGGRCVRCVAAAVANGEYDAAPAPAAAPVKTTKSWSIKPKSSTARSAVVDDTSTKCRPVAPKPVAPAKPIKVALPKPPADRHKPKSAEWRAKIAAAMVAENARRRAVRASSSHEPVTPQVESKPAV